MYTLAYLPEYRSNEEKKLKHLMQDIAVIRCLFISHWGEDGVFWSHFHKTFSFSPKTPRQSKLDRFVSNSFFPA
jgi:hypothetical protein